MISGYKSCVFWHFELCHLYHHTRQKTDVSAANISKTEPLTPKLMRNRTTGEGGTCSFQYGWTFPFSSSMLVNSFIPQHWIWATTQNVKNTLTWLNRVKDESSQKVKSNIWMPPGGWLQNRTQTPPPLVGKGAKLELKSQKNVSKRGFLSFLSSISF